MRAIAFILLCSCAPVAVQAPASAPALQIDRNLKGPGVSREAAEIFARKRIDDALMCDLRVVDCETRTKIAQAGEFAANKTAERHQWWGTYGPMLGIGSVIAILLAGVTGYVAGKGAR